MQKRLKITRIIAIIAFVMYLITMILPYKSVLYGYGEFETEEYHSGHYGYKSDYIIFFVFFIPALLFMLLKHSVAMKILSFITAVLLFGFSVLVLYTDFHPDYSKPNIGFYLFLFSALLMLVASVIKFPIQVPRKKYKQHELLDDLL